MTAGAEPMQDPVAKLSSCALKGFCSVVCRMVLNSVLLSMSAGVVEHDVIAGFAVV